MKILCDEILPPDVLLFAGTQNSSHFSILGVFWTKMYFFPPLTLKMTVKVKHFQGQNIKRHQRVKN
jgi:hypothetical protein